ncbi:MAG: hypothetical protein EXR69_04360 [Myxococcales bacterium]|nr:hypothetical protein [Myxococcales bacterium]
MIGTTGAVEDVTVTRVDQAALPEGALPEVLDEDALAAWSVRTVALARQLRFAAATEGGLPVAVELPLTIPFTPPPLRMHVRLLLEDGTPLASTLVGLRPVPASSTARAASGTTDAEGVVDFRGLADGEYAVVVDPASLLHAAGSAAHPFYTDSATVRLEGDEAADVTLYAHPPELGPILGLIARYDRIRPEVVKHTLSADEVRTTPGTMGDPLRAIANLPGAVRTPLDAGWLIVRGGDPRDTGVYIDGVRVPLIYHLGGLTSVIHPGFVDHVDFFPGGQSARYGRSTAGVVDLTTRAPSDNVDARAGANIILAGAYVSVPIRAKRASVDSERLGGFSAGFRRSYLDAVMRAIPSVTDEQAAIAPRFLDWQVRGDVSLPVGDVRLTGFGFVDSLDGSTGEGQQVVVKFNCQQVQGDWQGIAFGKPALIRPYMSYDLRQVTISAVDRQEDRLLLSAGTRAELQDDGAGPIGYSAGVDLTVDNLQLAFNDVPRSGWIGSPEAYADVRLGQSTKLVLGLRTDTVLITDQLPRFAMSPRASFVRPVSTALNLRADAGMYHQPPAVELLLGPPEGSALSLEYSWGGGGGATWTQGPVSVDVDAFGRKTEKLTQYDADGSLGQGEGLAFGLETMTKLATGRFAGWLSLSWTRSLRREESTTPWTSAIYDQPLTLVLVGSEDLGKAWSLSSRFRYASGFTAPADETATAYDVLRSEAVPLTRDGNGRLPAFHALDVKISRHVVQHKLGLDFYLDIQNVYNRRIPEPVITGLSHVYTDQAYGFGLTTLPILGVEGVYR